MTPGILTLPYMVISTIVRMKNELLKRILLTENRFSFYYCCIKKYIYDFIVGESLRLPTPK